MAHNELTTGHGFNFVYTYITPGADLLGAPTAVAGGSAPGVLTPSQTNLVYSSPVTRRGNTIASRQGLFL